MKTKKSKTLKTIDSRNSLEHLNNLDTLNSIAFSANNIKLFEESFEKLSANPNDFMNFYIKFVNLNIRAVEACAKLSPNNTSVNNFASHLKEVGSFFDFEGESVEHEEV